MDDDASVRDAIDKARAERGHIDVFVNNAGVGAGGAAEEVPLDFFRQMMETNFFGALRCMKAVIPSMRERRRGCIINVTSVAGRVAMAPAGASATAPRSASEILPSCSQSLCFGHSLQRR